MKSALAAIACVSPGKKTAAMAGAVKKTIAPMSVRMINPTVALSLAVCVALSGCPAPMFCHTSVEAAIDNPIAGMMTNVKTLIPIPYAAVVAVPKLATNVVIAVSPRARVEKSIDVGNHKWNIVFRSLILGLRFDRRTWMSYLPLRRIRIPVIAASHCVMIVAMAAPATPYAGTNP